MMGIKIFAKRGTREQARGGLNFFLPITILFHQCNDKNIYQQFYCCLCYIFDIVYIVIFFLCFYTILQIEYNCNILYTNCIHL